MTSRKIGVFYKEMENNQFEDGWRRDIAGVEGQIDYWKSDKTLSVPIGSRAASCRKARSGGADGIQCV